MTPERLNAYIRLVVFPLIAAGLTTYLAAAGQLEPWHLPLIAGFGGFLLTLGKRNGNGNR